MSDEDEGLFSIAIDDLDEEGLISETAAKAKERPRDWQTEEEFQDLKATYRAKLQNGDVSQFCFLFLLLPFFLIPLPLPHSLRLTA